MSTTIQTRPAPARAGAHPAATAVLRGRRRPMRVLAGAVLVVMLTATFMLVQLRSHHAIGVLVIDRAVSAGTVITDVDLRAVSITPDPGVDLIPADRVDTVVGRTAAVPLVAGTLLSAHQIGPPTFPANGQAVIALPVAAGHLPTGVAAGARVRIIAIASTTAATATGPTSSLAAIAPPTGTVIAVSTDVDAAATTVVSLLLPADAATAVAGYAGEFTLALLPPTS